MRDKNGTKQLLFLFFSSFVILFIGMGLFPLLPLYVEKFGATRTLVGICLAVMSVSNTAGPVLVGWLAERLSRKSLFIAAGVLGVPALVLMGQATELWQVVFLASLVWFFGGVDLALISVFTGLYADGKNRGKSFSLMSLAAPLGALVGGTVAGQLVAWRGYGLMFVVLGIIWAALPVIGVLGLQDKPASRPAQSAVKSSARLQRFGQSFYLLLVVSLLAATSINASRLGTSLSMQALNFSPGAVASSATVSGLITIPVTFLVGVLSDRLGRRRFLLLGNVMAAGGALSLSVATQLWHFWLAATLMLVAFCTNGAMGWALATDLLAPEALNRGLSWLNTTTSVASVLSFAGTGYVMETLGPRVLFLFVTVLPIFASMLLEMPSRQQLAALLVSTRLKFGPPISLERPETLEGIHRQVCTVDC